MFFHIGILPFLFSIIFNSTWFSSLPYALPLPLVLQMIEGVIWDFVLDFVATIHCCSILLLSHRSHHSFRQDYRFGMRINLRVQLFGHTFFTKIYRRRRRKSTPFCRKCAREWHKCHREWQVQQERIRNPIVLEFPTGILVDTLSSIIDDVATHQTRIRDSSQAVLAAEPVTQNIQEDFAPRSTLVRVRDALEFEAYYGYTRKEAWKLLCLDKLDPIKRFRQGTKLTNSSFLAIQSEMVRMKRACYAATIMFSTPGMQDAPRLQAGAFLTSDATSPEIPLIFDTGASFSVSPCLDDFISPPEPLNGQVGLTDFNDNRTSASGIGWVEWTIRDSFGRSSIIRTQAYYVPGAAVRLLCPYQYRRENKERDPRAGTYHSDGDSNLTLHDAYGNELHFVLSDAQRLPVMNLADDVVETGFTNHMACNLRTIHEDADLQHMLYEMNHNLSKPQKELRLWHACLAHAGFAWIQDLMRSQKTNVGDTAEPPAIPTTHQTTPSCPSPKCAACFFAKQHRRTPRTQTVVNKPEREMAIRRGAMKPGDCVSGDQYMSSQPGRLPNTYGREQLGNKYNGGTMLVDHYSAYIHLNHQISLRVGETLKGKHDFERFASIHGVKIRRYRADNQPFDSAEFRDDIELQDQELDFSGTGAHFQNGVAERAIQTVTTWARAMMMHQLNHWPDAFEESLWPFAMDQAIHIWNNLPRHRSGLSPLELFTGTKQPHYGAIQQARVWGCPAYVLDPTLQDGKKLPKWQKRARCGMYLGASPNHADSVGRILSLTTGHVSPQYHVVYDELFHTTLGALTDTVFDQELWNSLLVLDGHENLLDPEDRNDPDVLRPALDMYDLFREDPDPDDPDSCELDSVPEGESENDVSSNDETVATLNATSSNSHQTTQSGQTVKPTQSYVPSMSSERRYAATCRRHQPQKDHHKPHRIPFTKVDILE